MTDQPDKPGPLPALKLCNAGENEEALGALGNASAGKMYYSGGDRGELVRTVQMMLRDLLYDLGDTGPEADGVDGIFGKKTEDAVMGFQKENKDWDDTPLKIDGLVGPRTSDALNRAMVGVLYDSTEATWYDHYQTPKKLVGGEPYHAITSGLLADGLSIEPGGTKHGRLFIIGQIIKKTRQFKVRMIDPYLKPYANKTYRLSIGEEFKHEGRTGPDGTIDEEIPFNAEQLDLDIWTEYFDDDIPTRWNIDIGRVPDETTPEGASIRLRNLGYYSGEIVREMTGPLRDAIELFQWDFEDLEITGALDPPTCKKLKEQHDI
jgi:hypothetical protein